MQALVECQRAGEFLAILAGLRPPDTQKATLQTLNRELRAACPLIRVSTSRRKETIATIHGRMTPRTGIRYNVRLYTAMDLSGLSYSLRWWWCLLVLLRLAHKSIHSFFNSSMYSEVINNTRQKLWCFSSEETHMRYQWASLHTYHMWHLTLCNM